MGLLKFWKKIGLRSQFRGSKIYEGRVKGKYLSTTQQNQESQCNTGSVIKKDNNIILILMRVSLLWAPNGFRVCKLINYFLDKIFIILVSFCFWLTLVIDTTNI